MFYLPFLIQLFPSFSDLFISLFIQIDIDKSLENLHQELEKVLCSRIFGASSILWIAQMLSLAPYSSLKIPADLSSRNNHSWYIYWVLLVTLIWMKNVFIPLLLALLPFIRSKLFLSFFGYLRDIQVVKIRLELEIKC